MATRTVSTTEELYAALSASSGGDTINLKPGHYGDVWLHDMKFSSDVIIKSEDPSDPAVFQSAKIQFVENVVFDSVFIDFVPNDETLDHSSAVLISDSKSVTIRNSEIEGGVSVAGIDPDAPAGSQGYSGILGQPIGRGITAIRSEDVTLENNDISMFFKGMVVAHMDGMNILDNDIHDLRGSPLVGGDVDNVTIEGNHFRESYPWKLGGDGDHADMIHFWVGAGQTTPNENIIIRNNFMEQGDGVPIFGVFLESGTGSYKNVVIDGNVLHNGESQGFVIAATDGLTITNNTMLQSSGGINDAPKIALIAGTKNAVIKDNITTGIYGDSYENAAANNISVSGNLFVDYNDEQAANFVGNLLVDSAHSDFSLANLRFVPGSLADGKGSPLTQFDTSPKSLTAGFEVNADPSSGEVLVFDATSLTFGPGGHVGADDAEFTWNFGDGYKATGALVQRSYDEPGRYVVNLTVKTADGSVSRAKYEVGVAGEDLVSFDTATGKFVSHGYGVSADADATITNTSTADGKAAIVLGGNGVQAQVSRADIGDLFGADNFSLNMDLKATAGTASAGELFRVHGTFVASIDDDGHLVFQMSPKDGPVLTSISSGPTLLDGKNHKISIEFEGDRDRVSIMIDDELAGTLRTPSVVRDDYAQDMLFGNPWGGTNFTGEVHSFEISSYKPDYLLFDGNTADINTVVEEDHTSILKLGVDDMVLNIAALEDKQGALQDDAEIVLTSDGHVISFDGDRDFARLGWQLDFKEADELAISIDFQRDSFGDGESKLFWNREKVGAKIAKDGDLIVRVETADEGFKNFRIDKAGLNDTEQHNAMVMIDSVTDRMQVLVDGVVLLDETDTDFDLSDNAMWKLSAQGIRSLDGDILDFRLDDEVSFLTEDSFSQDNGLLA